jgi:hypothetical protein
LRSSIEAQSEVRQFGSVCPDKTAHLKTESSVSTPAGREESLCVREQYHDFIGFKVSKDLLERVFPVVYGMELKDVLAHEDLAIGSYRFAVSEMIPRMTQVALQIHKKSWCARRLILQSRSFSIVCPALIMKIGAKTM